MTERSQTTDKSTERKWWPALDDPPSGWRWVVPAHLGWFAVPTPCNLIEPAPVGDQPHAE